MCHFRNLKLKTQDSKFKTAFSLVETVTALIILAITTSSVLVVINRCVSSTADSAIRRQAFEVARDNMETVLTSTSVSEMVEVGASDKYPQIQWQTTIEPFYEPVTERMWVQAVCSAEYTDTAGELQTVELTHWLTDLTKEQLLEIIEQRYLEKQQLAEEEAEKEAAAEEEEEKQVEEEEEAEEEKEPDTPEPEEPPEPEEDCDALPFCEMMECYLRTGKIMDMDFDIIIRYFFGCR
jgi:DNA polymerase III alpha subunit (gram-positive type)